MAFYSPDAAMDQRLSGLVRWFEAESGTPAGAVSITWVRYSRSLLPDGRPAESDRGDGPPTERSSAGFGASWHGGLSRDPEDLVVLPYLIAGERWLQGELLEEEPELRRALASMTRQGSHEATSYVVDRLSGTTSGPELPPHQRSAWSQRRLLVNGWLASLGWPELGGCNACQKPWRESPYGRERAFLGEALENRNRFSSDGMARLLEAVLAGRLISPPACQRMRSLLACPLEQARPSGATASTLAPWAPAGFGAGGRLWGLASRAQVALYAETVGQDPCLVVLLSDGLAQEQGPGCLEGLLAELLRPPAVVIG